VQQEIIEDIKKLKQDIQKKMDKFNGIYEEMYKQNEVNYRKSKVLEDKLCQQKELKRKRKIIK